MDEADRDGDAKREVARLLDEIEQLRTALEASSDEVSRLADDRDRLLRRVATQARDLQAANSAYSSAIFNQRQRLTASDAVELKSVAEQEELRVAFEEMQVLTEELEVANNSLHETNKALDRRVEERTRELEAKNIALAESESRFRTLAEGIPQLVWRAIDGGRWISASPQWVAYTGLNAEASMGRGWLRAIHPDDRQSAEAAWDRTQAGAPLEMEGRIFHQAEQRYRHFRTRATAAQTGDGRVLEWLGTSTDVDDLLQLQARQQVLVAELQHRTRNLMTVVRALAERTIDSCESISDFRERFGRRLAALSRVQNLLSRLSKGARVTFRDLIESELSALGARGQLTLEGPAKVPLRSATVQTFALALHELATNALKYGAFATPSGHLTVRWSVSDESAPRLRVDWRESGVAMSGVNKRAGRIGYGRELIEVALPYQLGAETTYELTADGVHCTIEVPTALNKTEADRGMEAASPLN